ncbi:hypothetical protein PC129_g4084 [Phytophthora cactorum]|nr:hypothetical protein Pcac1_g13715 [Phytophthora cactorum]KAG2800139.1 hypothetical protein PC111_g20096 [Phytophthora cactorum]KAG2834505.1 hypothetical protein PC112_g6035 [Phytophthora cactorum]KAG2862566.1 hypothetical protein PC113_g6206 [Phytophthora cactorum]KAG2919479.1 hypothetical protein PC114_g6484 [Phytophthora cactorum]
MSLKMLRAPEPQKRPEGDFVDEKSGSKLLSYAEMLLDKIDKIEETRAKEIIKQAVKLAKRQAARAKEATRQAAKLVRKAATLSKTKEEEERVEMALHDKPKAKTTRKRLRQQCSVTSEPSSSTGSVRVAEVEVEVVETWVF